MPIGIGTGVSIGSATLYLFADASGISKGLAQAEKDTAAFERRTAQTAAATQKNAAAQGAAKTAISSRDLATSSQFVQLQNSIALASQKASAAIQDAYDKRNEAIQRHARVSAKTDATFKASQDKALVHINALAAAEKKLAADQAKLARLKQGSDKHTALDASINQQIAGMKKLEQAAARANANLAKSTATRDRDAKRSSDFLAKTIETANAKEKAAIDEHSKLLTAQAASYRNLAATAGPEYMRLARTVETAARKMIEAEQRVASARQQQNAAVNNRIAAQTSGRGVSAAVVAEERANRGLLLAQDRLRVARSNAAAADAAFTNKWIANAHKREAAALAEANKVIEAQKREEAARKQMQSNALDRAAGSSIAASAAMIGVVKSTTSAFGNFQEEMIKTAAISTEVKENFDEFSETIKNLAVELGKSPTELAGALQEVAQAGFEGADAMEIVEAAAKAAAAGYTDATTAARPFIGVLNSYKDAGLDAATVSDLLFSAVTEGVFSFQELSTQLGDNISLFSSMNKDLKDILASYVVLTKRSNSLSESTTQLNGIMNSFLKPTEALNAAIRELGYESAQTFAKQEDFATILATVQQLLHGNEEAAASLFPNIRALRGIFGLTNDELQDYTVISTKLRLEQEKGGETARVLAEVQKGFNFQMRQASVELQLMAISIGATMAPALLSMAKALANVAEGITSLNESTGGLVGKILGFTAGISLATFALLRFGVMMKNTVRMALDLGGALKDLYSRFVKTAAGARLMSAALTPLGITMGLALIAGGLLYIQHKRQEKSARDLEAAYKDLDASIEDLTTREDLTREEVQQFEDLADAIKHATAEADIAHDTIATAFNTITQGGGAPDPRIYYENADGTIRWASAMDELGTVTAYTTGTQQQFTDWINQVGIASIDDITKSLVLFTEIQNTAGINAQKVKDKLQPLVDDVLAGKPGAAKILIDEIADVRQHLSQYLDDTLQTENAISKLGTQLVNLGQFFKDESEAADEFRQALKGVSDSAVAAAMGLANIGDPLMFINDQLLDTGLSLNQVLLRMDDLNKIELTGVERDIIEAAAEVDKWQGKIDELNATFATSDTAISSWQAIISRTSDLVGTQADGFASLNDMVARNKVTTAEAANIQKAAIYLNERAKIGIDEERVAMAKALPNLAKFVQAHSFASDKYEEIKGSAEGFAAAMGDATNQAIIMTAIMLKLANAMNEDAFPVEYVEEFTRQILLANPAAAALLDTLGLIPEKVQAEFQMKIDDGAALAALDTIEEVEAAINRAYTGFTKRKMFGVVVDQKALDRVDLLNKKIKVLEDGGDTSAINAELEALDSGIADTVEEVEKLQDAWSDLGDKVHSSQEQMTADAAAAAEGVLQETGAILDLQDPVRTLNTLLGTTGLSFDEILLKMNEVGTTGINLDVNQQKLLEARAALNDVEEAIVAVDAAIQNNNEDYSMWQGRLDTINQALGVSEETMADYFGQLQAGTITEQQYIDLISGSEAEDGYSNLNKLVEENKLSRKEADDAIRDSIWLRERSLGGMEDEQAAQARLIPILRKYVEAHDDADGALTDLTDGQEGFLAAMSATNTAMALQTYMMFLQLEAMGKLAEGTADSFLELAGEADPVLQALLRDLGLIEDSDPVVDVTFHFPSENTTKIRTQKILDSVPGHIDAGVAIHPTQTAEEAAATPGKTPTAEAPEPVKIPAPDTTAADKGMADFQLRVTASGAASGTAFDVSMQQAITAQSFQVIGAVNGIATRLGGFAVQMAGVGWAAGVAFDQGMANAINAGFLAVGAAHALGTRTYNALKSAIESDSPSKKTYELGQFFVDGFTNAISDSESYAVSQARAMGINVSGALQDGLQSSQMDSILFGKPLASVGISQFTPSSYSTVNGGAAPMGAHLASNNVTVITPLRSDEYTQLLTNAERGGSAARFIDELPRAYGVRNGR